MAGGLVLVARADPASRGADLLPGPRLLARQIQRAVVRHDDVGPFGHAEVLIICEQTARLERVDLPEDHLRIDHHTGTDEAELARVEYPARDVMEDRFLSDRKST